MTIVALIPAYNPPAALIGLVRDLRHRVLWPVMVVNDGSRTDCRSIFEEIGAIEGVTVLRNWVNLGKGAALKLGINHALAHYGPDITILTLDADGQHLVEDVERIGALAQERSGELVLGVRHISFEGTPFRSFLGNAFTRSLFALLIGTHVRDTQTGLRAIPGFFAERLLKVQSNSYDFELEMLVMARQTRLAIAEQPVSTVYEKGNTTSHFKPIIDSVKIYRVLLRFLAAALVSAVADNLLFVYFLKLGLRWPPRKPWRAASPFH